MGYKKKYEAEYQYVLDCMEPDGFENATPEEKLKNFVERFSEEHSDEWKKKQMPVITTRVGDYLRGLPSSCSVDYETYSIFLLGQKWGYISKDIKTEWLPTILADYNASRFIDNWFRHIANRISELLDYYDIEFPSNCHVF